MVFVGGAGQAGFLQSMERAGPAHTILAGIDVGKFEALVLIADGRGELLAGPLVFGLDGPGVRVFESAVEQACAARSATLVRFGVEACGHYHRLLVHRLRSAGWDTVDLSPAQVHAARSQMGCRRLKSDERDAGAMIELLTRGAGRTAAAGDDALPQLQAWVAHRHRKQAARVALGNQLLASIDLAFPSLQACFTDPLARKSFWLVLQALDADIDQVAALTPAMLRGLGTEHAVKVETPKATRIVAATHDSLRLPEPERQARLEIVRRDAAMLESLLAELDDTDQQIAALLEQTPAEHDEHFATYRRSLLARGKRPKVANVAIGHPGPPAGVRAHPHPADLRLRPLRSRHRDPGREEESGGQARQRPSSGN